MKNNDKNYIVRNFTNEEMNKEQNIEVRYYYIKIPLDIIFVFECFVFKNDQKFFDLLLEILKDLYIEDIYIEDLYSQKMYFEYRFCFL